MANQIIIKFNSEGNAKEFIVEAKQTKLLSNNEYSLQRINAKIVQITFSENLSEVDLTVLVKIGNRHRMVIYDY